VVDHIIVVDNGSTDTTAQMATEAKLSNELVNGQNQDRVAFYSKRLEPKRRRKTSLERLFSGSW
jgi:glycosyltransferase involved in cell wall biosynthesis